VVDPDALDRALDHVVGALGAPRAVVYNASIYQAETALELTPAKLQLALDVHVVGALNNAKSGVRVMQPRGDGLLVFTVNRLARMPTAGATALSIGKGAQLNLALSLEQELAGSGVHVAIVTIGGPITAGTDFDPDRIAELYWTVANQDPPGFRRDWAYDG
jgi:NAD(P)-dependent dehydrogenase (short-subunit alcohol dehydrogenase family)